MDHKIRRLVTRRAREIEAVMEIDVAAPIAAVFDFVTAEDVLPKVLTGYRLLPGVVSPSGNTGPWDQPGSDGAVQKRISHTSTLSAVYLAQQNRDELRTEGTEVRLPASPRP
jgi:hypothetical protein